MARAELIVKYWKLCWRGYHIQTVDGTHHLYHSGMLIAVHGDLPLIMIFAEIHNEAGVLPVREG